MWLQSFRTQLIHDLKASWQKTALLGILLLVGCWFWIPPLVRAMMPGDTQSRQASDVRPAESPGAHRPAASQPGQVSEDSTVVHSWENVDNLLQRDPLVQSAEVAARHSDPFGIDPDQFPPPVLFAEETKQTRDSRAGGGNQSVPLAASDELLLRSTIVGEHRRAAFINRKLYLEGSAIEVSGKTYLLAAIYPRKVLLQSGQETLELKMSNPMQDAEFDDPPAENQPSSTD